MPARICQHLGNSAHGVELVRPVIQVVQDAIRKERIIETEDEVRDLFPGLASTIKTDRSVLPPILSVSK